METNITFSGAGFLGIYHIGVVSCLKFYGKKLLDQIECFGGSSAGALTSCMLLTDMDLEESVQFVMYLASKVNGKMLGPFNFEFDPVAKIRKTFMKHLPPNAYKIASGKLHISLTRVSNWENVIVNEFSSNKELVDALVCTSFVPFFSGVIPPKFRGTSYIDGGFSDNLPQHFSGTTITVSPFSGESDICPSDIHKSNAQFDMRNTNIQFTSDNIYRMSRAFFAPDNDVLSDMCRRGFRDALKYLHTNYPEMLDFGVAIISIPQCCGYAFQEESSDDDNHSVCSCGNGTTASVISEIEHSIAKGNAISNLIYPDQLNSILKQTQDLFQRSDLCWYLVRTISSIAKWLVKPCYYATDQLYLFAKEICEMLLPHIQELSSYSKYTAKAFKIALDVLDAYNDKAQYQWHPSMKQEHHTDVENSKRRLQTVQESLVTLPNVQTSKEATAKSMLGFTAPPPSRVSSVAGLCDLDFLTKLNEVVFEVPDESESESESISSDTDNAEQQPIINRVDPPPKSPFCIIEDDGLISKLDHGKSATQEHDYGSDLHFVPDPVLDAVVIGGSNCEEVDGMYDDSCDDFVNIE